MCRRQLYSVEHGLFYPTATPSVGNTALNTAHDLPGRCSSSSLPVRAPAHFWPTITRNDDTQDRLWMEKENQCAHLLFFINNKEATAPIASSGCMEATSPANARTVFACVRMRLIGYHADRCIRRPPCGPTEGMDRYPRYPAGYTRFIIMAISNVDWPLPRRGSTHFPTRVTHLKQVTRQSSVGAHLFVVQQ